MRVAVEGCAHGELDRIYDCIEMIQNRDGTKVDLLLCCGDFQAVRNHADLQGMAVPDKYKSMCSFHKYYSGEKKAPILTIFIGGNHEASNYLQELPFGGWVAPNIYYLGRAGVIKFGDLRIGGISGIYKPFDYNRGLYETVPYTQCSMRTVYHVRSLDAFRLSQLKETMHIMMSHDWPHGIIDYGDKNCLMARKPFLRDDIERGKLGSVPAEILLKLLKPKYWVSAHLHCEFSAIVHHADTNTETKFLALDKCLPKRKHLQVINVPSELDGDKRLKLDVEWLAVLKNTNHLLNVRRCGYQLPGPHNTKGERYNFTPTHLEKSEVVRAYNTPSRLRIMDESFVQTAPVYNVNHPKIAPTIPVINPQTVEFCQKLGVDDPVQLVMSKLGQAMRMPYLTLDEPAPPVPLPEFNLPPFILPPPILPNFMFNINVNVPNIPWAAGMDHHAVQLYDQYRTDEPMPLAPPLMDQAMGYHGLNKFSCSSAFATPNQRLPSLFDEPGPSRLFSSEMDKLLTADDLLYLRSMPTANRRPYRRGTVTVDLRDPKATQAAADSSTFPDNDRPSNKLYSRDEDDDDDEDVF